MDAQYSEWGSVQKFAAEDLDKIWMQTVEELYGAPGDVFTYENMEHIWAYVDHFHRPFYVYGYAFGELLTQGLYAARPHLGAQFEPLYLDLLRSGSTRDVSELLAPFGLDPQNPKFWSDGLATGLGALIDEAEKLAARL
jgi:oligoendopeptidase F